MSDTGALVAERMRLRALRAARYVETLWENEATSRDQGLSITPGEVLRRLLPPTAAEQRRVRFYGHDNIACALTPAIDAADAALAADPRWGWLAATFELSGSASDLLCAAVALELTPELGRVYAYIADDAAAPLPSIALAALLFEQPRLATPEELVTLRRWRLAEPEPTQISGLAGWRAAPAVAPSLASTHWHDPLLPAGSHTLVAADWASDSLPLQPEAQAHALARLAEGRGVDLVGPHGSGRQTLAGQIAAERGQRLLIVDTLALVGGDAANAGSLLETALRLGRAEGALTCFTRASAASTEAWRQFSACAPKGNPVIRCLSSGDSGYLEAGAVTLEPLGLDGRLALWRTLAETDPPPAIVAARATPGDIARIAAGLPRSDAELAPPDLLTRLPTPYGWDDIALPLETEQALRGFVRQIELRGAVLQDWGFERLTHLGAGLIALFAGPSGVGKTMATQVLAAALGFELYRIDLAGVVDKYIGETEKHLRSVFDFAERPGVLLLFDEADALFGNRTQSKDSHDRYANQEINYLLQRLETFEGVAVLATNRRNELDAAFRRRLQLIIDFLPPGPAERLRLWKLALPEKAPNGTVIARGIDYELLAQALTITGADIKSAAIGAAFLARAEGSDAVIGMPHVLAATARELTKHGQAMRLPIEEARRA